jgi:hypothetical protein
MFLMPGKGALSLYLGKNSIPFKGENGYIVTFLKQVNDLSEVVCKRPPL